MLPLDPRSPFIAELQEAVSRLRHPIEQGADALPLPTAPELAALCNRALALSVDRYEGERLSTTVFLLDAGRDRQTFGFMPVPARVEWSAIARGFPEGLAARLEHDELQAFAGLTIPPDDADPMLAQAVQAVVLPGVVGLRVGGHLVAELRPGRVPRLVSPTSPSLGAFLASAGYPVDTAPFTPAHLRRIVRAARSHGHGTTVILAPAGTQGLEDVSALAGGPVHWPLLAGMLEANASAKAATGGPEHVMQRDVASALQQFADRYCDALGRLACIDGALALDSNGVVLGYGLRLQAPPGARILQKDLLGADVHEYVRSSGARRQSAADFIAAQPDCLALVLSSDGPVSLVFRQAGTPNVIVQRGLECLV